MKNNENLRETNEINQIRKKESQRRIDKELIDMRQAMSEIATDSEIKQEIQEQITRDMLSDGEFREEALLGHHRHLY